MTNKNNMSAGGELRLRGMFGTGFVTFHWQDDGSVEEEILETMRMTVLDLDEVKNTLEMKIREYCQQSKSFECIKTLCNNFNKIIETLLSLWKGTHRLHELHRFPSVTFLEHVMKRSYKKCVRNSSCMVFDKNTFLVIDAVFKHFQLTEDDVLTEINSGSGGSVIPLQVSAISSFKCCNGILLPNSDITSESEHIAAEFTKWMDFYGKDYTEFRLCHEDLMSSDMLKLLSESTVIFLKDLNVEPEMESKISSVFSQLNESCRIISFENLSELFGFKDRIVDVKEYTTGKSDVKYFVHVIKTRAVEDISPHLEDISHLESQALSSSLAEVQKKKQLPLAPSISASSSQTEFKAPEMTKDARKVLPSSEGPSSFFASLDNILGCYRNQFIKFIEFMQTKEYRVQLGEAVKEEQVHKTELKNKIQSLLLQINELNGSSLGQHGLGSNSNGDVLTEVRTLVIYNRQLKIMETLLKNEICQLEKREVVQDDLLGLNHKSLLRKAGDCYEKYIQLKEKVRSLEAEVATLEGRKENSANTNGQVSTENSTIKNTPMMDVVRQFPVAVVADASDTRSTTSSPKKRSHREQQPAALPFSKSNTSMELSFQRPRGVDQHLHPPALPLHFPSVSGDSLRVLHGSNGKIQGLKSSSVNNDHCSGFSGVGVSGLADGRRGSSSSTDTADSGQDQKYGAQNFEGNSISSWPNSPDPFQLEVSRGFPGLASKSQQVLRSAIQYSKPLVQSADVRMPVMHCLSEEMMSLSQTMAEVLPVAGRGKLAPGKRGRRKRAAPDDDDGKHNLLPFLGKRGRLTPLARTETDTGWKMFPTGGERDNEMRRQDALLEGCDLALGFHQGIQHSDTPGSARLSKSNGMRPTKTDAPKAQDAGSLDALLLAVSLHHLPPSHRNLGQDLASLTTKIPARRLRMPLMHGTEHLSSTSFLPLQLSSSSMMRATGNLPLTTLSWSLPQVSGDSKSWVTMQEDVLTQETPTVHPASYERQVETLDDSHGKHFKKRFHSTNFKHYRAKKMGNTAAAAAAEDCPPNPSTISEATTMPILKSLFSKRTGDTNLAPIIEGDQREVDKHPNWHLPTGSQPTTTDSRSTKISSGGHYNPTTRKTAVNPTSDAVIPKSEISQCMNASYPSAPGVSWFSLPLSIMRQIQLAQSDTSSTAQRQLSESDELLLRSVSVYASVSNQRTTMSSLTSNVSLSSGTVEPRGTPPRAAVTKSSSR